MLATDAHWLRLDLPLGRMVRGLASLSSPHVSSPESSGETSPGCRFGVVGPVLTFCGIELAGSFRVRLSH
jgi:hypothetical protein